MLLLLAAACAQPTSLQCTSEVSPRMATLVEVDCVANDDVAITYSFDGEEAETPALSGEGTLHFDLFGTPEATDVAWTATTADGTASVSGSETTGALPDDLPRLTVTVDEGGWSEDERWFLGAYYMLSTTFAYLVAFDRAGRVVWYMPSGDGTIPIDVQLAAAHDGTFYFNEFSRDLDFADSRIRQVTLDGRPVDQWATPQAHHMFAQLDDGTFAYQQLDIRPWTDDEGVTADWVGDAIAVVDRQGNVEREFSVWDWETPAYNRHTDQVTMYPGVDWTHGNSLRYDADAGLWLLSLGHTDVVMEIDRATATPVRRFGQEGYPVVDGLEFDHQHDAHWSQDGTLLMFANNADTGGTGGYEYVVDDAGGELRQAWQGGGDAASLCLGQVRELANDDRWVNYGCGGRMQEWTLDGRLLWEVAPEGMVSFAQFVPLASFW